MPEKTEVSTAAARHPVFRQPAGTLPELIRRHADTRPAQDACIILDNDGAELERVSYVELDRRACALAATMSRHLVSGDRVLIALPTGMDFVVGFLGCLYAGAIAVPVPHPGSGRAGRRLNSRLESIIKDASPTLVLTTAELVTALDPLPCMTVDEADPSAGDSRPDLPAPDTVAMLQYTSGSTSSPKGAVIRHRHLMENLAASSAGLGVSRVAPEDVRSVSWLPLFHDMGLGQLLVPLYVGGTAVLMPPTAFVVRPAVWLESIGRYQAYFSSAPNFAYDLCAQRIPVEQRAALDLSGWQRALNGAEPVNWETMERFAEAFADRGFRRSSFMPSYGLAEGVVYVAGQRDHDVDARYADVAADELLAGRIVEVSDDDSGPVRRLVACGHLPENLTARIVDPDTLRQAPADRVGEIWLTGSSIVDEYWGQPEASAERFGGRLAGSVEGPFLRTGDLGFLRDGQVYVLGRSDDLIIVDGRNHHPQDLELTAGESHPALARGRLAAFAFEQAGRNCVGLVAETDPRARVTPGPVAEDGKVTVDEVVRAVRRAVSDTNQIRVEAVVLLKPGGLPLTTSGKVQRSAARQGYLDGTLDSWPAAHPCSPR